MALPTEPTHEEISALKSKYGDGKVHALTALGKTVIVKQPEDHEYQMFLDYLNDDEKRSTAMRRLLDVCVVWPAPDLFRKLMSELPGLYQTFGSETAKLAGFTRAVEVKKL